jgi:hypothetical protein
MPAWTATDAWVLAAIPDDPPGCTVRDLIAFGDFLDHAIPTADELAASLGALIAAGLVEHLPEPSGTGRFRHTTAGLEATVPWHGRGYWHQALDRIRQGLKPFGRPDARFALPEAAWRAAVDEYQAGSRG